MILQGMTAVITGATSGIGQGIARLFAKEGAQVAVVGQNRERGQQTVAEISDQGGTAAFFQADLRNEQAVQEMVEAVVSVYGGIDILVNNAGIVIPGAIPDISLAQWEATWQTNVTTAYLCSRFVLPQLQKKQSGIIINIASEAGLKGLEQRAAYCTSKFAMIGLTKAMAVDHAKEGIRVNCVCPGTIETEMVNRMIAANPNPNALRQKMLDRRLTPYLGTIEEVARAVLFLANPENTYMTGTVLTVDGGASVK